MIRVGDCYAFSNATHERFVFVVVAEAKDCSAHDDDLDRYPGFVCLILDGSFEVPRASGSRWVGRGGTFVAARHSRIAVESVPFFG